MKNLLGTSAALLIIGIFIYSNSRITGSTSDLNGALSNPALRAAWEHMLLQDPETGLIPVSRSQELAFARNIPSLAPAIERTEYYNWNARGPFNFGGRTRGAALDIENENILIAGSISGHIYKSMDQGLSWEKKTASHQTWGITCLIQDKRSGKTGTWYAGSGEGYNSAGQGLGARFIGNGILKSTDNGESWTSLQSTQNNTPETIDFWDRIWRIALDPTAENDVVLAAAIGQIMRSEDGGNNWVSSLSSGGSPSYYSEVVSTSAGVFYATLSADGTNSGIFRSANGVDWTNITPTAFPGSYNRIVIGINPSNENEVYFLAETPGTGKRTGNFRGDPEWVSLWKYDYITGDGSGAGGFWENRSENLPKGPFPFDDINLQGGYDMLVEVKPGDANTVFIGGTNIFRSTSAFADSTSTTFIGGYVETTTLPDFQIYQNHHPDQHKIFFSPSNPNVMYSANDGGVQRTMDVTATPVVWESLNNGYNTTQFYSVALDHATNGSNELIGGLQDNGTFYTNSADPYAWKFPWSYDGAFTAISDGGDMHLTSIQLGRMFKIQLDANGNRTGWKRFDPIGGTGYNFIHPWAMDPADNGIVYLPLGTRLWKNDQVDELPIDNGVDSISTGWTQLPFTLSGSGSSVGVSTVNPAHRVYVGTASGNCYRVDNADQASPTFTNVSNFEGASGYLNCIAVDPEDGNHAMAIFSNYNVHSIHFTEDGGETWFRAGGNLEAAAAPEGAPEDFYRISNAPSIRWARIMNIGSEKVYFVGTSVGLYGTKDLAYGIDRTSDSTVWVQVAKEEIGNTVVMMLDSRESDDYLAVATHGSGMFGAHISNSWGVTNIEEKRINEPSKITIFPNPSVDRISVRTTSFENGSVSIQIIDLQGRIAIDKRTEFRPNKSSNVDISSLNNGTYTLTMIQGDVRKSERFVVLR